jgi:hypothetical protein
MTVRILRPFAGYKAGQVFDWGDGAARIYIARGLAEEVSDRRVETATFEKRTEKAVLPPVKRGGK